MSTALATQNKNTAVTELGAMSVTAIVDRKRKILEVMNAVMKDGEHYGKVGGTQKPTLLKAGAEVLATVFALAPTFKITRTDIDGGHREYEITCTLTHIPTGAVLGEGVGSCSTMESKYRWRKGSLTCPECGKDRFLLKSKRDPEWFCWQKPSEGKDGCGAKFKLDDKRITEQEVGRKENPDIADTYNTVLKMAKKRAQVDATLTAVGASDILTQDLEDLPQGSPPPRERDAQDAEFTSHPASPPAGNTNAPPSEPASQMTEDEMQALITEIRAIRTRPALGKFWNERLKVESKRATGGQYKLLRETFEEQQDLIDEALAQEQGA